MDALRKNASVGCCASCCDAVAFIATVLPFQIYTIERK
jgi:hypothetical protein